MSGITSPIMLRAFRAPVNSARCRATHVDDEIVADTADDAKFCGSIICIFLDSLAVEGR